MVILGDFNAIKGAHERRGSIPHQAACREFCSFINDLGFIEPPSSGLRFTWSGRKFFPRHIESILDRALLSRSFSDNWLSCSTLVLPRASSDHSPLVLRCATADSPCPRPFRFQSMWIRHPEFDKFVKESWSAPTSANCPMISLMVKLKRLKTDLKEWNRSVFGQVESSIANLQANLQEVQSLIVEMGYTDDLFEEEVTTQANLNEALNRKNEMARQQSRTEWLKDGDRNTSFFHNIAKRRRAKHSISNLLIDGSPCFDKSIFEQHIVDFFAGIFKMPPHAHQDHSMVDGLIPNSITAEQAQVLITVPSDLEIKAAVFLSAAPALRVRMVLETFSINTAGIPSAQMCRMRCSLG